MGVSFLPNMTVQDALTEGTLVALNVVGVSMQRRIGLAWRRGRYFSPAIQALLDLIVGNFGLMEVWQTRLRGTD